MSRALAATALFAVGIVACAAGREAPPQPGTTGTPAATPVAPEQPISYEARLGKDVYRHYCQTCHGDAGAGDGFNAFNLDPRPRDLSEPAFQKKKSDADLRDAIRRGGSGVGLSALMPPWERTLSDRQVGQLVAYLRSLQRTVP